jgi:hypothetical protein
MFLDDQSTNFILNIAAVMHSGLLPEGSVMQVRGADHDDIYQSGSPYVAAEII